MEGAPAPEVSHECGKAISRLSNFLGSPPSDCITEQDRVRPFHRALFELAGRCRVYLLSTRSHMLPEGSATG